MSNPIYTIIIPTHNRGELLKENLDTLLPQVRKYQDEVSIFVSDNASKDNTQEIVKPYLEYNADILDYHRHEVNIGYAANFMFAVRNAKGKYVCLMGDDDIMFPNHVEMIVETLKKHPDVGVVNYNMLTVGYDLKHGSLHEQDIRSLGPVVYPSGKEFIMSHLAVPSHMSSNVFNREAFISCIQEFPNDEYAGYQWLITMYRSTLDKPCVFIGYPLSIQRLPIPKSWEEHEAWYQIYGFGSMFEELDKKIPGLYQRWREHVREDRQEELAHILISASEFKETNRKRFERMKPYMISPEYVEKFLKAIE